MPSRHYLSREEMRSIVRDAHRECQKIVPVTSHLTPGGKRKRGRDIVLYRDCLKKKIIELVDSALMAKGINVGKTTK